MIKMKLQLFGGPRYGGGRGHAQGGGGATASAAEAMPSAPTLTVPAREFPDKAKDGWDGGWEYKGRGKDQVDFFKQHSNYDELIKSMNDEDHRAFRDWMSGHFMSGQQYGGWDNMSARDKAYTRAYDKILDQSVLDASVRMTRLSDAQLVLGAGHRKATLAELQAMEGKTVTSKGSMSFGVAAEGLTIGASRSEKNVEYKLTIPGGSKGAGMWIGDKRIGSWGAKQREFMTNRDIDVKVGKTTYDRKRDLYVVELQYEARRPHDYGKKGRP